MGEGVTSSPNWGRGAEYATPQICHFAILIILNCRYLRNSQYKRTPWSFLVSRKWEINLPWEGTLPIIGGLEICFSPDTGNLRPRILYKQDLSLIQQFTTLRPNSFVFSVLPKFTVSLSKRYKSFLLWSFLWVSYFLWGSYLYIQN